LAEAGAALHVREARLEEALAAKTISAIIVLNPVHARMMNRPGISDVPGVHALGDHS